MKKNFVAAAVGAMLIGGSAMAVELAPNGKGDVLIAPMFMTGGQWSTELKVINTSLVDSAVAKLEFHAPTDSAELRDFFIFLSPGDVWTGVVSESGGTVRVNSTDDSAWTVSQLANGCTSATGTPGISTTLNGNWATGYVNVFETKMIRGLPLNASGTVDKAAIIARFSADCSNGVLISDASTDNVLTGSVKLSNPVNGNVLNLPMTALANYNNSQYHNINVYTGFFANAASSTKMQVEDAIWQSNFVVPYNNAAGQYTFATVTFPTKETFYRNSAGSQYSPFVGYMSPVPVGYSVRDEQENTFTTVGCTFSPCTPDQTYSLLNELNIISIVPNATNASATVVDTKNFSKGWVNMTVSPEAGEARGRSNANYNNVGQLGAPALATYIQWTLSGSQVQGTWNYAPSTYTPGAN